MPENTTHTSPSGFMFTLRPVEAVPERLRRPVASKLVEVARAFAPVSDGTTSAIDGEKPQPAFELTPEDLLRTEELNDLLAVALVVSWSVEAPITVASLLDLPAADYSAVRTAVAPMALKMMPDFSPTPEAGTPTTP